MCTILCISHTIVDWHHQWLESRYSSGCYWIHGGGGAGPLWSKGQSPLLLSFSEKYWRPSPSWQSIELAATLALSWIQYSSVQSTGSWALPTIACYQYFISNLDRNLIHYYISVTCDKFTSCPLDRSHHNCYYQHWCEDF